MPTYSFADCLAQSYKVNWRIDDVLGERRFAGSRRWLPTTLSGAGGVTCLDAADLVRLSHVEMAAYAHLFGYVEEFIAPKISELARDFQIDELVGGARETAEYVRSKSTGAVLLLTAVIEWFTQRHFVEAWRDDEALDDLTKRIFRAHWLEESQHARMDHLEAAMRLANIDSDQGQ